MKSYTHFWLFASVFLVGTVAVAQEAGLELSAIDGLSEQTVAREENPAAMPADKIPAHEAIVERTAEREPAYTERIPPQKIAERSGEVAPSPDARWVEGYWDWDKTRKDFVWVTGTWRVPPPGKFWVEGFWRRTEKGWYRVPGFWSERRGATTNGTPAIAIAKREWIKEGPPPERPEETVGLPPAPNFFWVPGEYVPQGAGVAWRAGFWYQAQPGWEWYPAHWVRHATGWAFREGHWNRIPPPGFPPPGNWPPPGRMMGSMPGGAGTTPNNLAASSTGANNEKAETNGDAKPNSGGASDSNSAAAANPTTNPAPTGSQPPYYYGAGMPGYYYSPLGRFVGSIRAYLPF